MSDILKNKWVYAALGLLALMAIWLRCYNITANEFVFYDEGMYLVENRKLLHLIEANPARNPGEFIAILGVLVKSALSTAKAFWFFLLNLRVFIWGTEAWSFARIISMLSGFATLGIVYLFAKRLFNSKQIAILSVAILAVLPSHVFYSRLGMQESLSTLFFVTGIYLYVYAKGFSWRPFIIALLLALTFFCNYRMIIAPLFLCVIEGYRFVFLKERLDWQKWGVTVMTFALIVAVVGSLYDGANRFVTFGWMGHQAQDASGKFDVFKFLSFPLNTFVLEGFLIGAFFWHAVAQAWQKQWTRLLPAVLVLTQMAIFSVAADQGARYLCVVLPFFAISCAQAMESLLNQGGYRARIFQVFAIGAFVFMVVQSYALAINRPGYEAAVDFIKQNDPQAKIISTQPLLAQLYVSNPDDIQDCPKHVNGLMNLVKQGYYYLMIDPQAAVSWSRDDIKFNAQLLPFLEDIRATGPVFTTAHFNQSTLIRFVLDHNEHLSDSWRYISHHTNGSVIEVYDLRQALQKLSSR